MIEIRVMPRSGRAAVAGVRDGAVLVRLTAAPVEGAANDQLIDLLARALGVPKRALAIMSGARGRRKRVRVDGTTARAVREILGL